MAEGKTILKNAIKDWIQANVGRGLSLAQERDLEDQADNWILQLGNADIPLKPMVRVRNNGNAKEGYVMGESRMLKSDGSYEGRMMVHYDDKTIVDEAPSDVTRQ